VVVREEEPRHDRPDEAMEFFLEQRLAPGAQDLPLDRLYAERAAIEAREAAAVSMLGGPGPGGILGWTSAGPGNIGGRTRSLVIDPSNPNVMYAGGVAGGVWKSNDGGASWLPTSDQMENLAVTTLAMDPTNPQVIYAGTGEGFGAQGFVRGLGVFKTEDGGAHWTQLPATANAGFHWVNEVVISPNDHLRLYAATRHGVWRSPDGGVSWTLVLANPTYATAPAVSNGSSSGCTDIAIRTDRNPDVLFAAFGIFDPDGLFRSDDSGDTWLGYALPNYQGRMSLAIAPGNNDRIYIAMADNGGLNVLGRIVTVYRSDDGENFASVLDMSHPFSPWLMSYVSIATGCVSAPTIYSQGWYDNIIAVDPANPDVVWLGGIDLYRSDNAGVTFGMAGYWFNDGVPPTTHVHADQHMIVFHPGYDGTTNQTMYVTNDGGLYRTNNARAATTQEECPIGANPGPPPQIVWQNLNHGYGVTQYYHGDAAVQVETLVGGAQDNGSSRVQSFATPNAWDLIFGGDGGYVAIDPTQSQRMFVEYQGFPTIQRSLNGGNSFLPAVSGITDTDGLFITPFAMDQTNPQIMWTGGQRPWRTTNGASSWQVAGPNFNGPGRISAIAITPSDHNIVFLGFDNGYVVRSSNALAASPTWQILVNGLFPGAWVSSIAVDPSNPNQVYLTYSNYSVPHLLESQDGGGNWTPREGSGPTGIPDIPAHWVAVRPCDSQQLYVGTELGVFASDDRGATWTPSAGVPHTVVETLDFRNDQTLVAFTFGRGAFVASLVPCGLVAVDGDPDAHATLAAGPTPFRDVVTIRGTLPRAGQARLTVHDASGRQVAVLADGHLEAGPLRRQWDGRDPSGRRAAPGIYFVRLTAPDLALTRKVALRD
ncbi:MAG TPA: FlgD immunoglobulin-like domain containing protein, partial [Candidatus Eisenbacteria bacterium]|nr:FlgD immunoglobulin-like domain containing protein [Candidatus Eisenbacteria bacterium]